MEISSILICSSPVEEMQYDALVEDTGLPCKRLCLQTYNSVSPLALVSRQVLCGC